MIIIYMGGAAFVVIDYMYKATYTRNFGRVHVYWLSNVINTRGPDLAIPVNRVTLSASTAVIMSVMSMYKCWLRVIFVVLVIAATNVYSSHFRGGAIMVRPKLGGTTNEVLF